MDKLDKPPEKDLTQLKTSITQGVISNTVFQIGWNGVSFMIGLLTRHYALIFGIPPFLAIFLGVVAFFLMALSYNLIRRRKDARALNEAKGGLPEPNLGLDARVNPAVEILSPFNNEEVGLYETVRGHVFPPDQDLQVLIFAPDKKWYPQPQVDVKASMWTIKCQFGHLDSGAGAYKIAAVLGSQLNEAMWYDQLPDGLRSNVVEVRRKELTIEQELSRAIEKARNAKLEANQEKGAKDSIYDLYKDSEQKLAALRWLSDLALEQAKDIGGYIVATIATFPHAGELVLEGKELCVIVGLNIKNESVFSIDIHPKDVSGSLTLNDKSLREPINVLVDGLRRPINNLRPRETQMLVLEQPLREFEAERIKKHLDEPNAKIWIGGLTIVASSGLTTIPVKPAPIRLNDKEGNIPLSNFKCNTINLDTSN